MATPRASRRKAVKFTPSTKSSANTDSSPSSSDPLAMSPSSSDRKALASANKRKKLDKGIHAANILPTLSRSSKQTNLGTASDGGAPSPKRQRVTRHQGHNPLNYDSRLHPLDKYTRPSHFAKVNAEYHNNTTESHRRGSLEKDNDISPDRDEPSSPASQEADSEASEGAGADTVHKEELAKARSQSVKVVLPEYSPSPGSRRSSRNSGQKQTPNYNMKVHPAYDRVCRPASFKAALIKTEEHRHDRRASTETETNSTIVDGDSIAPALTGNGSYSDASATKFTLSQVYTIAIPPLRKEAARTRVKVNPPPKPDPRRKCPSSIPPVEDKTSPETVSNFDQIPSEKPSIRQENSFNTGRKDITLDFKCLSSFESRLYRLQYGAPADGKNLPHTWDYVMQKLLESGDVRAEIFTSGAGTKWIKAYYEKIRLGVEAFFGSKPEPTDARDWTLKHMEGFDVFDRKPKSKYWKHYDDCLYRPTTTSLGVPRMILESEAREEIPGGKIVSHDLSPYTKTSETILPPTNVGASEFESGATSPLHANVIQEQMSSSANGGHGKGYIDLEDEYEDYAQYEDDLERTLVEGMSDTIQLSDNLISSPELEALLSPVAKHLIDYDGADPKSTTLHDQSDSVEPLPVPFDRAAKVSAQLAPSLMEAFNHDKLTSVSEEFDLIHHLTKSQASTAIVKGRKGKAENSQEVLIHEDSPGRETAAPKSKSPKTDIPKENFEIEEETESSSDIHVRTPTPRRENANVITPPFTRVLSESYMKTPRHPSLFGGPIGELSPSI